MQTLAVEIAPPGAATELRRALLDVCSRAAQSAVCVEPDEGQESTSEWVAIVSWTDPAHVHIEVSPRVEPRWVVRDVSFGARDPIEERWRAVGLLIGTLSVVTAPSTPEHPTTGELAPVPETSAPKPVAEKPPEPVTQTAQTGEVVPVATPPTKPVAATAATDHARGATPAPDEARRVVVDGSGVLGSALDDGPVRLGVELDGRARATRSGLYVGAGFAYSVSAHTWRGLGTTWAEAFGGLSYEKHLSPSFTATAHAEGLVERLQTEVNTDAAPTSGDRLLGGARFGADLRYWVTDAFGVFAGGSGKWVSGTTDIRVGGVVTGTAPALGYVIRAGVSYGIR